MTKTIIVAVGENNVIGRDNQLIWHLPKDLKFFKEKTTGHHVIMGRKTYESCGKPLPNRVNIVITRQEDYQAENCIVASSINEGLNSVKSSESEVFIIGGAEIYKQALALDLVDKMYITRIHHSFEGDTYFPEPDMEQWEKKEAHEVEADEKNPYPMTFLTYEKR